MFTLMYIAADITAALPHSRRMEFEVDELGLEMMARSCYDVVTMSVKRSRFGCGFTRLRSVTPATDWTTSARRIEIFINAPD